MSRSASHSVFGHRSASKNRRSSAACRKTNIVFITRRYAEHVYRRENAARTENKPIGTNRVNTLITRLKRASFTPVNKLVTFLCILGLVP